MMMLCYDGDYLEVGNRLFEMLANQPTTTWYHHQTMGTRLAAVKCEAVCSISLLYYFIFANYL